MGDATEVDAELVVDVVDGHGMSRPAGAPSTKGSTNSKISGLEDIIPSIMRKGRPTLRVL